MKNENELIYDLIFSNNDQFRIDISDYIKDIYQYDEFMEKIKAILKKSKVKIISNNTVMSSKTVIWEIKVKK